MFKMADEQRRRAENIKLLQDAVTQVLSPYEKYEFINILNHFQRKKEIDSFVASLRELLDSPAKQELIPYLLSILSHREREKFMQLWMKTSHFKVYYADDGFKPDGSNLRVSDAVEDKYSSVRSFRSLPLSIRGGASRAQPTTFAAWRTRRLNQLRAERDRLAALDEGRYDRKTQRVYNSVPTRIKEGPAHRGPSRGHIRVFDRRGEERYKSEIVLPLKKVPKHLIHSSSDDASESHLMPLKRTDGNRGYLLNGHKIPTRIVYLSRNRSTNGFGLSIRGGIEHGLGIFISGVERGSAADDMGLYVGDQILSLNDQNLDNASHTDVVQMIMKSRKLRMEIVSSGSMLSLKNTQTEYQWQDPLGRPCSPPAEFQVSDQSNGQFHKSDMRLLVDDDERKVNVIMDGSNKIGLKIRGGNEYGLGIYVAGVDRGSVAEKSGLKAGDQILDINGTSFLSISHQDAASVIKSQRMMTITLRDVGKIPFATTVYGKDAHMNSKQTLTSYKTQKEWQEKADRDGRESIFRQGIAGSQLMHQSVVGVSTLGMIEEQGRLLLTENELKSLKYYVKQYSQGSIDVHGLVLALLHILDSTPKMSLLSDVRSVIHPHDIDAFDEMVLKKELAAQKHRRRVTPVHINCKENKESHSWGTDVTNGVDAIPFRHEEYANDGMFKSNEDELEIPTNMASLTTTSGVVPEEIASSAEASRGVDVNHHVKAVLGGSHGSDDSGIVADHCNNGSKRPPAISVELASDPNYEVLAEESDTDQEDAYPKSDPDEADHYIGAYRQSKHESDMDSNHSSDDNEKSYGVPQRITIQINGHASTCFDNDQDFKLCDDSEEVVAPEEIVYDQSSPMLDFRSLEEAVNIEPSVSESLITESHAEPSDESFDSVDPEAEESPYTPLTPTSRSPKGVGLDHLRMALSGLGSEEENQRYTKISSRTETENLLSKPTSIFIEGTSQDDGNIQSLYDHQATSTDQDESDKNIDAKDDGQHGQIGPSLFLGSDDVVIANELDDVREETKLPPQSAVGPKSLFFVPFGFKQADEVMSFNDVPAGKPAEDHAAPPVVGEGPSTQLFSSSVTGFYSQGEHQEKDGSLNNLIRSSSARRQMREIVEVNLDFQKEPAPRDFDRRPAYSVNPAFTSVFRISNDHRPQPVEDTPASSFPTIETSTGSSERSFVDRGLLGKSTHTLETYQTLGTFTWNSRNSALEEIRSGLRHRLKEEKKASPLDKTKNDQVMSGYNAPIEGENTVEKKSTSEETEPEVSVRRIKQLFEGRTQPTSKGREETEQRPKLVAPKEKSPIERQYHSSHTEFEFRSSSFEDSRGDGSDMGNSSLLSHSSLQDLDLTSYSGIESDLTDSEASGSIARRHSHAKIVKIDKSYPHLGLALEEGLDAETPILRVKFMQGGKHSAAHAASEEYDLKDGHEIVAVDGESLEGLTHGIANLVLRQAFNNPDGRYLELLVKPLSDHS